MVGLGAALALGACVAPAPRSEPVAARTARPMDVAAGLPAEAAGFRRGTVIETGSGDGVEVGYAAARPGAVASVTLYPPTGVADDPDGAAVADEFERLVGAAAARGASRGLRVREQFTQAVPGGAGIRCALLRGGVGSQPVRVTLCAGAGAGRIVAVRVTLSERAGGGGVEAGPFAGAVVAAVRRGAVDGAV